MMTDEMTMTVHALAAWKLFHTALKFFSCADNVGAFFGPSHTVMSTLPDQSIAAAFDTHAEDDTRAEDDDTITVGHAPAQEEPRATGVTLLQDDEEPDVARFYKHVDVSAALAPDAFLPMEKVGTMYVARLARPLLVQTPVLSLASPLEEDEDEQPVVHAHLALPPAFAAFVAGAEAAVLEACLANKQVWFKRRLSDESLRARFKEFYKASSGHLKVRVPRDMLVFDAEGRLVPRGSVEAGGSLRCILQLAKVCFGRTEFGAMWSVVQAQTAPAPPPPPKCLIDPSVERVEDNTRHPDPDDDVHEFL